MSQQQQERPQEPIKYGHVSSPEKAVAPEDVPMMQKGGAVASMQSAASKNESSRLVGREGVNADSGVSIKETECPRKRVISEYFGKEVRGAMYRERSNFKKIISFYLFKYSVNIHICSV